MRVAIDYGLQRAELEVAHGALVVGQGPGPSAALPDVSAAVRDALEHPHEFPSLRRALTPDDEVAILLDERLPHLAQLLVPVLEHLRQAGIPPGAVTLLTPPPSSRQEWIDELPDEFEEVRCEVHDPEDRKRLAFVTTTSKGRQLYFNRTAVDAAQVVVLAGRRFDTLYGHGGGEGFLYPQFGDESARAEASQELTLETPDAAHRLVAEAATEAAWLLGVPFFVQVIEGFGDTVSTVIGGVAASLPEGRRLYDQAWTRRVPQAVETVVATVSGDPGRQDFSDLADALACASRVLTTGGRIILLTEASPAPGPATALLAETGGPAQALAEYRRRRDFDLRAAWLWATVAQQARIYLLSGLPGELVEDMGAVPLTEVGEAQRLVRSSASCLFLRDAHKTLALVE